MHIVLNILSLDGFKAKEIAIIEKDSKFKKLKNGEYRYLDKKLLSPITTLLYDLYTIFFIWTEPYYAIRIKDKNLINAQEEYFNINHPIIFFCLN